MLKTYQHSSHNYQKTHYHAYIHVIYNLIAEDLGCWHAHSLYITRTDSTLVEEHGTHCGQKNNSQTYHR